VRGVPATPLVLRGVLDTDTRRKTRVRPEPSPDPTRHTLVAPLPQAGPLPEADGPLSVLLVRIHRGGRHQIRAHLADAGFPVLGDTLYGAPEDAFPLHLHHAAIALPGFSAVCAPSWLISAETYLGLALGGIDGYTHPHE
ncbi:MAG: hypothetical protein LBV01_06765, partial [Deltaproteobacteria bacterium]|nr:hypothetical protein [Deltaproteobacteria bacterium]